MRRTSKNGLMKVLIRMGGGALANGLVVALIMATRQPGESSGNPGPSDGSSSHT